MESWNAWIGQGMEQGWMVDPGDALNLEGRIVNHEKVVSDGPFASFNGFVQEGWLIVGRYIGSL